jgi:hypothetical protein
MAEHLTPREAATITKMSVSWSDMANTERLQVDDMEGHQ